MQIHWKYILSNYSPKSVVQNLEYVTALRDPQQSKNTYWITERLLFNMKLRILTSHKTIDQQQKTLLDRDYICSLKTQLIPDHIKIAKGPTKVQSRRRCIIVSSLQAVGGNPPDSLTWKEKSE